MPVARWVARMVLRSTSSSIRRGLLGLLRAGSDPLEADIIQAEVLGIGAQEHTSLGDVLALATSFLAMSAARLSTEATSM